MLPRLPPGMITQSGTCVQAVQTWLPVSWWAERPALCSHTCQFNCPHVLLTGSQSLPLQPLLQRRPPHLPVELLQDLDGRRLLALQPQAVHGVGQVDGALRRHLHTDGTEDMTVRWFKKAAGGAGCCDTESIQRDRPKLGCTVSCAGLSWAVPSRTSAPPTSWISFMQPSKSVPFTCAGRFPPQLSTQTQPTSPAAHLLDQLHAAVKVGVDGQHQRAVGDGLHQLRQRDLVGGQEHDGGDACGQGFASESLSIWRCRRNRRQANCPGTLCALPSHLRQALSSNRSSGGKRRKPAVSNDQSTRRTRRGAVGGEGGGGVAGGCAAHRLHRLGLDLAQPVHLYRQAE